MQHEQRVPDAAREGLAIAPVSLLGVMVLLASSSSGLILPVRVRGGRKQALYKVTGKWQRLPLIL